MIRFGWDRFGAMMTVKTTVIAADESV